MSDDLQTGGQPRCDAEAYDLIELCGEYQKRPSKDGAYCDADFARTLENALRVARNTIEALHGPVAWEEYQKSPQMKIINTALT